LFFIVVHVSAAGLDFCLQLQDLMSSDDHFLEKVQFSDQATFHVSGAVNRRNVRIWESENSHVYVEHQRDSPKVNHGEHYETPCIFNLPMYLCAFYLIFCPLFWLPLYYQNTW
jgi:hypothetical protein